MMHDQRAHSTAVLPCQQSSQCICREPNRTMHCRAAAPPGLLCVHPRLLAHPLPACNKWLATLRCVVHELICWLPPSARSPIAHAVPRTPGGQAKDVAQKHHQQPSETTSPVCCYYVLKQFDGVVDRLGDGDVSLEAIAPSMVLWWRPQLSVCRCRL